MRLNWNLVILFWVVFYLVFTATVNAQPTQAQIDNRVYTANYMAEMRDDVHDPYHVEFDEYFNATDGHCYEDNPDFAVFAWDCTWGEKAMLRETMYGETGDLLDPEEDSLWDEKGDVYSATQVAEGMYDDAWDDYGDAEVHWVQGRYTLACMCYDNVVIDAADCMGEYEDCTLFLDAFVFDWDESVTGYASNADGSEECQECWELDAACICEENWPW
jgi:hypothetical protein